MIRRILSLTLIIHAFVLSHCVAQDNSIVTLADPFILLDGDTYYAYGTGDPDGIAVWTSTDLQEWTRQPQLALHKSNTTEEQWFWAPEVYYKNGQYYMYYSANEHLYVATASSPLGPFRQVGGHMMQNIIGDEKCIDSSVFFDEDGTAYCFFVRFTDGNCIWMCQLANDLVTPIEGTLSKCINVSQPWENLLGRVNEGPFILKHGGIYYLTYSGNDYRSQDYAVGYAMTRTLHPVTGAAPTWSKYTGNPILRRVEDLVGTGHHSFFTDKQGRLRIVFHAHDSEASVAPRRMYIGTMEFSGNRLMLTDEPIIRPTAPATPVAEPQTQAGSGIYVGGHIRRERPQTITKLKNSGFTYAILFNVSVEQDGTLTTDGETICRDGQYVFANEQPHYADDIRELKTWPTGISRVEICIGGWGNESYSRIRSLINTQGTGPSSALYRNFKALKEAIPELDAVNNDDEHCYDATTAVQFHTMMHDLGYKTTVAPYTNKSFWQTLVTQINAQRPGACDRVLIQCYDGGAYNNPHDWQLGGLPLHAGRTNYQSDMQTSVQQMETWRDQQNVVGGFIWVYNDESWSLNQWASAMNRVFPTKTVAEPVATFYADANFEGYAVSLPAGQFSTGELSVYGITDKDIASFRLAPGYQLTTYVGNDLTGVSHTWTDSEMARMNAWANRVSSLKIEKTGEPDHIVPVSPTSYRSASLFDLQGRKLSHPRKSGLYIKNHRLVIP